ncbi:ATPase inhibitor subunit zeta [Rhizobium sp. 0TCS1.26]|uniref:ATPase inhibitor subunit zeta n=1 Tax=Rhizobium sp. 0TCS1.26 TaxID=3142623 RepID=UPI003D2774B8
MVAQQITRRALEEKYILDFRMLPKTRARRDQQFARWAAQQLQEQDVDAYLAQICRAGKAIPGDEDILQKVLADFRSAGKEAGEEDLRALMHEMMFSAAEQLEAEFNSRTTHTEQDDYLEEALEETFPASDPIAPGHPIKPATGRRSD